MRQEAADLGSTRLDLTARLPAHTHRDPGTIEVSALEDDVVYRR
jgi:hypothetical protein